MTEAIPPLEIYRTHMFEFKLRLLHCERVASANQPVTGLAALDSEFCFLQLRRLVELIAFSSVLRYEQRYKALRKEQQQSKSKDHGDHTRDWEAPEILRRLVKISPYCLPIPLKSKATKTGTVIDFDRKNISVTHGRLIEIYVMCGGFLHAKNPLHQDYRAHVEKERKKYKEAKKEISKCLTYFRNLMWQHAAVGLSWSEQADPKEAADPKAAWLINFGVETEQAIHITVGESR